MKIPIHLFVILLLAAPGHVDSIPQMKDKPVVFTVVDISGNPVEKAYIEASKPGTVKVDAYTDAEGKATLLLSEGATLAVYVSKTGYYQTGGRLWEGGMLRGPEGQMVHQIVPEAFTIELKPVIDPVSMRNHRCHGRAPLVDGPIGYDLKVGSWVEPHGSGKTADLLFQFHNIEIGEDSFNGTMTIRFPNEGDGIQAFTAARPFSMAFGSDLAPPHRAPVEGYQPEISYTKSHRKGEPYQSYRESNRNYLIRTRTRMDASGRILQACYGWIQGEIEFDPRDPKGPQLSFTYYFNSDPDPEKRSLEYKLHVPWVRRP